MSHPSEASHRPPEDAFERARQLFVSGLEMLAGERLEEAERSFHASLELLPGRVSTLVNLAAVRVRLARPEQALEATRQLLEIEPRNPEAWFHRAEALARLHRRKEALESFRQAALLSPAAVPWYRHGQILQDLGRDAEALDSYDRALAADSSFAPAWTNKGNILREMSRLPEAEQAFRQAIAHGAADEVHGYYLASVAPGAHADAAPGQYVESLFDAYAEDFDRHVVDVLGYCAHEVLAGELFRLMPGRRFGHVLDLGCGTGLCGARLKAISERMTGVDLSSGMLAKAEAGGHYDQLVHQDIAAFLDTADTRHDLVVATDVFIYIGDLAPVFAGIGRAVDAGGLFCFSVETLPKGKPGDFELQPTLRFAHSEAYARRLAAEHGFEVIDTVRAPLRQDQRQAIDGLFIFLRKRAT